MRKRLILSAIVCLSFQIFAADTVQITPTTPSIPDLVTSKPEGTVFMFAAGTFRNVGRIIPNNNQQFIGALGANGERLTIISGAIELKDWKKEGKYWVHENVEYDNFTWGSCRHTPEQSFNRCKQPQDLYMDDMFMREAGSMEEFDTLKWDRMIYPIGAYEQQLENKFIENGVWYIDSAAKKVYIHDDPTGHKMEISKHRTSFGGPCDGVLIQNLIVEKYANHLQAEALGLKTGSNFCTNPWDHDLTHTQCDYCETAVGNIIDNCEARWNHAVGTALMGCGTNVIKNCYVHHNGQMGLKLNGTKGAIILNNEIAYNCMYRTVGAQVGEDGGTKFVGTNTTYIIGNYVHHNWDNGIWFDGYNIKMITIGNISEKNTGAGIFYEMQQVEDTSKKIVKYNISRRNGYCGWFYGAQIQMSVTANVDISYNLLEVDKVQGGSAMSIMYQTDDQGRKSLPTHHIHFHHNDVTWNDGRTCNGTVPGQYVPPGGDTYHGWGISVWGGKYMGAKADVPDSIKAKRLILYESHRACVDTCGNKFEYNTYHLKGGEQESEQEKYWRWPPEYPDTLDRDGDGNLDYAYAMFAYSLKDFQEQRGQDLGSTIDNNVDTSSAVAVGRIKLMGAPDSIVTMMEKHLGVTANAIRHDGYSMAAASFKENPIAVSGNIMRLSLPYAGDYLLNIINARGQVVLSKKLVLSEDRLAENVKIHSLANGIYSAKLSGGKLLRTAKFVCCN